MPVSKSVVLNKKDTAYHFGISVHSFEKWGVPHIEKKGNNVYYDLKEVIAHRLNREKKEKTTLTDERTKLVRAQAKMAELKLSVHEGELIPSEIVQNVWADQILNFRSRLLSLPTRLAKLYSGMDKPTEIEANLRSVINETLSELIEYKYDDYKSNQEDTEEDQSST